MDNDLANDVLDVLGRCLAGAKRPVALHEPRFEGNEWRYVKECLDSGWVSSVGAFVDRYESDLAALTGVRRAVAVVNGTAALHMCLLLAGVEREDEVLMPTLTFVATANAVVYCGAVPHLVDSDASTLGVDPEKLRAYMESLVERRSDLAFNKLTGRRIRALVVMHTFGHPADLESLSRVCGDFGLVLIEDAAESLGSFYKGRPTGNWGLLSAVSFNGNKIVTAGGGGAILTNNVELGDLAKHLTTTARRPHRWEFVHDAVGYNYRLPNINAALGCAQLEQLPESVTRKRALAVRYRDAFASISGASFFLEPEDCCSNYWLNALLIDPELANQRDRVLAASNEAGFMTRPVWSLMHRLPMYAACPRMNLDVAESLASRVVNLPSSAFL